MLQNMSSTQFLIQYIISHVPICAKQTQFSSLYSARTTHSNAINSNHKIRDIRFPFSFSFFSSMECNSANLFDLSICLLSVTKRISTYKCNAFMFVFSFLFLLFPRYFFSIQHFDISFTISNSNPILVAKVQLFERFFVIVIYLFSSHLYFALMISNIQAFRTCRHTHTRGVLQ